MTLHLPNKCYIKIVIVIKVGNFFSLSFTFNSLYNLVIVLLSHCAKIVSHDTKSLKEGDKNTSRSTMPLCCKLLFMLKVLHCVGPLCFSWQFGEIYLSFGWQYKARQWPHPLGVIVPNNTNVDNYLSVNG